MSIKIRAVNIAGPGPASTLLGLTVTPGKPATAPTISSIDLGDTQLVVNFTTPSDNGGVTISNYQYSLNQGLTWNTVTPSKITSPITITGLTNGVTYGVSLRAVTAFGGGLAASPVFASPQSVPGAPTITSIESADTSLIVNFDSPTSSGGRTITNYKYSVNDTWYTRTPAADYSPLVITGLTNGTSYNIALAAVNSVGYGESSESTAATPADIASAPTITSITPGDAQLAVNFTAPSYDGGLTIENYRYSLDLGTTYIDRSPASTSSPITITGLTNGTSYQVKLKAITAAGAGNSSLSVQASPCKVATAPTISGITVSSQTLYVAFTAPEDNGGSAVTNYKYSLNQGSWQTVTPQSTSSPITISELINGTQYSARILAVNAAGDGAISSASSATPGNTPTAPTITSVSPGNAQLSVSFSAPTDDGGSSIVNYQYSTNGGTTWTTRSPAASASPIVITGLINNTVYSVKIRAVNAVGAGTASAGFSAQPYTVPSAPSITSVAPNNTSLTVNFTAPSSNGGSAITSYKYSTNDGATYTQVTKTTSPIVITGLINGTSYNVRLRAVNNAGDGAESSAVTGTPASAPGAPTVSSVTAGNTQLTVDFTAPSNDGGSTITNYQYSTNNGATWTTLSPASTSSPITITGLTNGTTYNVGIRAVNSVNYGASSTFTSKVPGTTPGAPTITTITPGNTQVSVSFTAPTSNGGYAITNYAYSTDAGTSWTNNSPARTISPITITGLTNGDTYDIQLRAINSIGDGAASTSVTIVPGAPGAPILTSITPSNSQLTVYFTAPVSDGGSTIIDYLYSLDSGTYASIGTTTSPFVITDLTNNTTHTVTLKAVNSAATGPASNTLSSLVGGVPGSPAISNIYPIDSGLSVYFTAPESNGGVPITNYKYAIDGGNFVTRTPASTTSPITIAGLTNGTEYNITLAAVNPIGTSDPCAAVAGTPQIPAPPTQFGWWYIYVYNGAVLMSVNDIGVSDQGTSPITEYQYSLDGGITAKQIPPTSITLDTRPGYTSNFSISGDYEPSADFCARAVNLAGPGPWSEIVQLNITRAPIPPPYSLTAGNGQVTINYTPLTSNFDTGGLAITSYSSWINTDRYSNSTESVSVGFTNPVVITGLTNGVTYWVDFMATNSAGTSDREGWYYSATPHA